MAGAQLGLMNRVSTCFYGCGKIDLGVLEITVHNYVRLKRSTIEIFVELVKVLHLLRGLHFAMSRKAPRQVTGAARTPCCSRLIHFVPWGRFNDPSLPDQAICDVSQQTLTQARYGSRDC